MLEITPKFTRSLHRGDREIVSQGEPLVDAHGLEGAHQAGPRDQEEFVVDIGHHERAALGILRAQGGQQHPEISQKCALIKEMTLWVHNNAGS